MRVGKKTNIRVEVTPYVPYISPTEAELLSECERLATEARKHLSDYGDVRVSWDILANCSHCGYAWTEAKTSKHNGGCCDEDYKVLEEELKKV